MVMRIWAWTTSWWNDEAEADKQAAGQFGLTAWHANVVRYFSPTHCYVACGTWSAPAQSPLPAAVTIINAGLPHNVHYDRLYNQLREAAVTAGTAYALNHSNDWDLLVFLDTDILVGAVDFDALLKEFVKRPEILLAQSWWDGIGGPFYVWKRAGAIHYLHGNTYPNIIDPSEPPPPLGEVRWAKLYAGKWWNPWPQFRTLRQDFGGVDPFRDNAKVLTWPFVRSPDPAIVEEYQRTQTSLAKPVQA